MNFVNRKYRWYPHVRQLAEVLQKVADDILKRVMIFMHPRTGKSELMSRLFPAYYLRRHPDRFVGLNSYAGDLAFTFSRAAQDNYLRLGDRLKSTPVNHWLTQEGGGLWAAGVGGPITGKGFHLGLIDDPIKNAEEAASETIRAKHKDWYDSTFSTREEPGGAIVMTQTRWHEEDLAGYVLGKEDEEPEHWHIVHFEAIKEEMPPEYPVTCTLEPDFRQPGEALVPDRYPIEKLLKFKRRMGTYFWQSLYQQRPGSFEGNIFKRQYWRFWQYENQKLEPVAVKLESGEVIYCPVVTLPESLLMGMELAQSWDMTFKGTAQSSWVVGQVWGIYGATVFLLDQLRDKLEFTGALEAVRTLSKAWPRSLAKFVEDKANGPAVMNVLQGEIPGLIPIEPHGDKIARARAIAPMQEAGNIYLPHPDNAPWIKTLIANFAVFPNGKDKDEIDAMSQIIIRLFIPQEVTETEYMPVQIGQRW